MHFNNIVEIQNVLDKTCSVNERLQTSLILLQSKLSELLELKSHLNEISMKCVEENKEMLKQIK